jgi:hypothetical protein
VNGAAGAVGSMVTPPAREFGAYMLEARRAADRQTMCDARPVMVASAHSIAEWRTGIFVLGFA